MWGIGFSGTDRTRPETTVVGGLRKCGRTDEHGRNMMILISLEGMEKIANSCKDTECQKEQFMWENTESQLTCCQLHSLLYNNCHLLLMGYVLILL